MIGNIKFLVFVTFLIFGPAHGDLLNANDAQSCMEQCASCEGTSTFENGLCECIVPEGNKLGIECVKRLKRDTDNLDLVESSTLGTSERSARCSPLGSRRRLGSADADRVAKYFMNGGPLTGSSLLGRSNPDCSQNDQMIGSSNPKASHAVQPVSEPKVSSPYSHSPVVGASNPSNCATGEYQPIVGTQWLPNYGMGPRMLGATHQPVQGAYYYPHDLLGAVPHYVLGIPNALMRATHIPAHHNPGLLGSSHHSPLLASIASGAHGALQRLDNMIAPYATEHNHGNIVSSPHATETPCDHSHQHSYPHSHMVGAPRVAAPAPNPRLLQQVLAHQNTLLEALSNQLASYSPHVASPAMQYAPMPYMLGAAAPIGQCYCPGEHSPVVGASNPHETKSKSSPDHVAAVMAKNPHDSPKSSKSSPDHVAAANPIKSEEDSSEESEENKNEPSKETKKSDDEKPLVGAKEPKEKNESAEEKVEEKNKRESRSRSTIRKKRGDVKYFTKKSTASQN